MKIDYFIHQCQSILVIIRKITKKKILKKSLNRMFGKHLSQYNVTLLFNL